MQLYYYRGKARKKIGDARAKEDFEEAKRLEKKAKLKRTDFIFF